MNAPRENRLARETSPYLLAHRHNPVDWYPWGEEALALARREDKPIFLSIGYSACHWCHVMERESFEDEAVAATLAEHFVSIKVDREERPDVDALYMTATVAMTGGGGWPMTVFLAPDGRPFFAGTYFPKTSRFGRPGFHDLVRRVAELWKSDREGLLAQADQLVAAVKTEARGETPRGVPAEIEQRAVADLVKALDRTWGGFGGAPKFPAPGALTLLLHAAARGDAAAREAATLTLDRMARGGIYDQVGGGFARYATDARWHVPHFEKMLYDNAQLARVYALAHQVTGDPRWADVANDTLAYVAREMQGEHGGYFSATDADSEGVEGRFFVWSKAELAAVVGADDAPLVCAALDVREDGNWEGHNVLWLPETPEQVAAAQGVPPARVAEALARAKPALRAARARRVAPACDDKVLTSWNGLMIGAMAFAGRVLGEPRWVASAARAAALLRAELTSEDGALLHSFRAGRARVGGFLEDYAFLAEGLIDLYEASGELAWLTWSLALAERAARDFAERDDDAFFSTRLGEDALIVRMREGSDGATPSPNAVLARALARLAAHFGRPDLRARAERAVAAHGRSIQRVPRAFACSLDAADRARAPAIEVALIGEPGPARDALDAVLRGRPLRRLALARWDGRAPRPAHPLLEGKDAGPSPLAFVCRDFACALPVSTPAALAAALDGAEREAVAAAAPAPTRASAEATRHLTDARAADAFALGPLRAHRAGVALGCFHEDDVAPILARARASGRNLVATDLARAPALGDAIEAAARAGAPREELVLVALLATAERAHAAELAAKLRVAIPDLALVPLLSPELAPALAAASAIVADGHAGAAGLWAPSLDALPSPAALPPDVRVLAAPLNLLEGDPAGVAALHAAGVTFLALRPLEIRVDGRVAQLNDAGLAPLADAGPSLREAVAALAALEAEYRDTVAVHLARDSEDAIDPKEILAWSQELARADGVLDDLLEVEAFLSHTLAPALSAAWGALAGLPGELGARVEALRGRYLDALDRALKALGHSVVLRQAAFAKRFADVLGGGYAVPDLPARAARAVLAVEGVGGVLIEARKADQLFDLGSARPDDATAIARVRSANPAGPTADGEV